MKYRYKNRHRWYAAPRRRKDKFVPRHWFDGEAMWRTQRRTAHLKKYPIDYVTWYIFIWLCMLDTKRHHHHHDTWKKTRAGRNRRCERKWKEINRAYHPSI